MKIQDVMTAQVKFCEPENNIQEVIQVMKEGDFGVLPVVNKDQKIMGIITDRDICMGLNLHASPKDIKVMQLMNKHVVTCKENESISHALKLMRDNKVRRLPVLDSSGKVSGIISLNDIVLRSGREGIPSYEKVVNTFKAICEHGHLTLVAA